MKKQKIFLLIFCQLATLYVNSQSNIEQPTSINTTGSTPDPTAMLDVSASDKGMLVPRLNESQRMAIASPATGLLVFDTDAASFWFYNGSAWAEISTISAVLQDTDGDTKIQVEESFDEDLIRFDLGSTEKLVLQKNAYGVARLELLDEVNGTFVGFGAGANNHPNNPTPGISGIHNTFLGYQAGTANTSGDSNTFLGNEAGKTNTNGHGNTASGSRALYSNTFGNGNTASGRDAMYSNTSGSYNAAFGERALQSNTAGYENTATGRNALSENTTGSFNTANGNEALHSNTDGNNNTGTGKNALYANTTGNENTANGVSTLGANTTGNFNTGHGSNVLTGNNTGSGNTAIGQGSLSFNTSGDYNTALGHLANVLSNNLTNATAIGYNSQVGCSNCLVLGGTGADAVNVGIGTNTPSTGKLVVDAATTGTGLVNLGKLLIGTDTPLDAYNGTMLHINSSQFESRIILKGANGGSNYNSFLLRDNNGNGWDINHKSQVWNNHFLVFDYFDNATQTYKEALKLTSDGRVGLGYAWNENSSNSKLSVKGGDVNIVDIGSGIIMKSPDGQCWRVTIDNSGGLSSASIACP